MLTIFQDLFGVGGVHFSGVIEGDAKLVQSCHAPLDFAFDQVGDFFVEDLRGGGIAHVGAARVTLRGVHMRGDDAVLLIEVGRQNLAISLDFTGGGSTVRGLVINRSSTGLRFTNGGGNVVEGNFIGTDPTGTLDRGNAIFGVNLSFADGWHIAVAESIGDGSIFSFDHGLDRVPTVTRIEPQ